MTPLATAGALSGAALVAAGGASGPLQRRRYTEWGPACKRRRSRSLRGQVLRGRRDLLPITRSRVPRQPQGVSAIARDDVDVEVEHGLPRRRAAGVQEVHAVGAETLAQAGGQPFGGARTSGEVLVRDLEQVGGVAARDDQQVAAR